MTWSSVVFGQSLHDFKEIWVNESKEFLLNNQKPLPYLQSGFHQFSRVQDEYLLTILEQEWEKYPIFTGISVPKSRKFDAAPQFVFEETSYHNPQFLPCYWDENRAEESGKETIDLPRIRKPEYTSSAPLKLTFKFYGNNIAISYDRLLALTVNQPVTNETISDYWKRFVVGNSQHLIAQLMSVKDRLGLNDWGYFNLVKTCSSELYPNDNAGVALSAWALMIRSGFDVRIGYNQLGATVLFPATSRIYSMPFVRINNSDYYIDSPIASFPISSYSANPAGATSVIQLQLKKSLNFQGEIAVKKIQFTWDKKLYEFNLKYNPEVVRFLEEYPSTDPELCFNAPFTALSTEILLRQIKPVIAGMKKEEAVAFLQQFVQKSFAYHPYNDLYGRDRFMFPEELLFKDESNDKGKSLLFAWMISNLLNQKAALVEFPGFFSVAISLDQPLDGDNFLVDGKKYTMAEPTYENAPLGLVMNGFHSSKPFIRILRNVSEAIEEQDKIWKLAHAFGAERSGAGKDFLQDENGNSYITGFFKEKTASQNQLIPTPFVAKFDIHKSLVWMVKFRSDGMAFGLELKQLEKNEFYLAGTFRGKLESNGIMIQTALSDPDLFFAQFNSKGEIAWLTKSGLDELEEDTRLFYIARFTRSGDIQSVELANEDERRGSTGFQPSSSEGLCYIASRYQTTGLDKAAEEVIPKSPDLLKQNLKRMRQLGIEQTIATLASLLISVNHPGDQLFGTDLNSIKVDKTATPSGSLSEMNSFSQNVRMVKNKYGIVEINLVNSTGVKISSFKIANRAQFKIIPMDNNDLKLRIISGFEFESGMLRQKINSMILELSTGNVILDLGNQHQIVSRNLRSEFTK